MGTLETDNFEAFCLFCKATERSDVTDRGSRWESHWRAPVMASFRVTLVGAQNGRARPELDVACRECGGPADVTWR